MRSPRVPNAVRLQYASGDASVALLLIDRHRDGVWPRDVALPEGWIHLSVATGEPVHAAALQAELEREVDYAHPLAGLFPRVIARSLASDDVLVQLGDGWAALVHLTWARTERRPQDHPATIFVGSQQDFDAQTGG